MHFKTIKGKLYAYESRRVDGRLTSRSYGVVPLGMAADYSLMMDWVNDERDRIAKNRAKARREASRRAEDEREAAVKRRALIEPLAAIGGEIRAYGREVDSAVGAALALSGYHRHHRGEWRRRRTMIEKCEAGRDKGRSEIRKLIQLARDGDDMALNKLPAALDEAMHRAGGDLEEVSEYNALELLITAKKGGRREPVEARMEYMRRELAPEGSPFEVKLLASRAVLDWLHVQCWEQLSIAFWVGETPKSAKANAKTLEMVQRQLNSAVARYQRSLLALARVKRLSLPVVVGQLNVAVNGPQVNQARVETH